MEIREWAERILLGNKVEDKLFSPKTLTDQEPGGSFLAPDYPGRPHSLDLSRSSSEKDHLFSRLKEIESEEVRGQILHFFANHELLALELMALCLLKFPQAPAKFRRQIAETIKEEQIHVSLYMERMRDCGVLFGSLPVSDFFWRSTAPMERPEQFISHMSLTFEQANLDYSLYYGRAFLQAGDEETARLMERVYLDEIGHVSIGRKWLEHWKESDQSLFEFYAQNLLSPLSPQWGKGKIFDRQGRIQAGLPEEFIDEMALFSQSRSRSPYLYWFHPTCEAHLAVGADYTPPQLVRTLVKDLDCLPGFLSRKGDVVITHGQVSDEFLSLFRNRRGDLPQFLSYEEDEFLLRPGEERLEERSISGLRPWGWSPKALDFLCPLVDQLTGPEEKWFDKKWVRGIFPLYSKVADVEFLKAFLDDHPTYGDWLVDGEEASRVCIDIEEVEESLKEWREKGVETVAVKWALASSGQGLRRVSIEKWEREKKWLEKSFQNQPALLVEPWRKRVLDLSFHFQATGEKVKFCGFTRLFNTRGGQYRASVVGDIFSEIHPSLLQALWGGKGKIHRLKSLVGDLGRALESHIQPYSYRGPLGVDAYLFEKKKNLNNKKDLLLQPASEINPRYTMGRVALEVSEKLAPGRVGLLVIVGEKDLAESGFKTFGEVFENLEKDLPWREDTGSGRLLEGVLPLSDIYRGQRYAAFFLAARTLGKIKETIHPYSFDFI